MENGKAKGWTAARPIDAAPRLRVRHGAAGLMVREAPLVAAWGLLWLAFPLSVWTSLGR